MPSALRRIALVALAVALTLPMGGRALAQESTTLPPADDYETTRGMAMGLGARPSAASTSGPGSNPATCSLRTWLSTLSAAPMPPISQIALRSRVAGRRLFNANADM